jgi:hypothetical protein
MAFFLTPEEIKVKKPTLADHPTLITLLVKTQNGLFLREVDPDWKGVAPLGTKVVPLPSRITVQTVEGGPLLPRWSFYIALSTDNQAFALIDIRPDEVAFI